MSTTLENMTAISIVRPGDPDVLVPVSIPVPKAGRGEILVQVHAAGINRPDILQRQGLYAPPDGASPIPGLEIAGEVVACGPGASHYRVGEAITALVSGGGYAEYCAVPEGQALPVPKGLDMVQAASLPETFFTVWTNVFDRARLQSGETFLVHGGASGIGTTAVMLAKAFGARVFATCSGNKCAAVERLGAEVAIDYRCDDFVAVVKGRTNDRGADVILDMVGGDYLPRNLRALAPEGRLVQIAFLQSSKVELDLSLVMQKRLYVTGSTLRPRSTAEKAVIAASLATKVWPLLSAGQICPVIHATFPLSRAADAHRCLEAAQHIGKIVLTIL